MTDRIFGLFGILLAIGFVMAAFAIEESFLSDVVGPKAFPLIIATVLGVSSAVIALRPDPEPVWPPLGRLAEIAAAVLVMVLYAELLPVVGFVISTAFAAGYLAWRLGSRPLEAVLVGVGTSVGIYVIFHLVLGLSLARGPLGF
ncbi:tripartite tricarboxylate transporter TctB family protein [Paracoccus tegillarcae]|uniref:Tripartite tricarboxylate transporter TctB family protein n=1 Tax=Paracoccus tegillarcae TaxID=1529068 RepID=A0A2K9EL12_9RHOB|nr:tripartite tricarboxylate transporter TctB family protein [Paracoccus tegillarcae]AUH35129.1 tripartite tricarboxylate transporter TctB family protein [Paracoccus tegillarcae]